MSARSWRWRRSASSSRMSCGARRTSPTREHPALDCLQMPSPIGQGRFRFRTPNRPSSRPRPYGVRLYLAFSFAAVALITAGLAYLLVSDTAERAADEELAELAVGRTVRL